MTRAPQASGSRWATSRPLRPLRLASPVMSLRKSFRASMSAGRAPRTISVSSSTARRASSPSALLRHSSRKAMASLEESVDDFGQEHVLGEEDLAFDDLEDCLGVAAQAVVAAADEDVHLVLEAVLVAE